ncbi:MAG: flagellar protein FlgN [Gammaproteobacteria bacterium]|nr:flagellar protein FlgN [Gammaproteobacteria bacterium]
MNKQPPPAARPAANTPPQAPVLRAQQVLQSLTDDRADLLAMNALLEKEKSILDSGEHKLLEATAHEKIQLAAQLDARHQARATLLPKLPNETGANDSESAQTWNKKLDVLQKQSGVNLAQAWQEVESLLKKSNEKLKTNEKIVSSLQSNANRFINLLREQNGGGKTYTESGEAQTFSNGQPLGSA